MYRFPNGRSALAAMQDGGVDVLLTDKNLPDIGGLELLNTLIRFSLIPKSS